MLFWTPHFSILDSTFFDLDSTFWLDSTLKIDPATRSMSLGFYDIVSAEKLVRLTGLMRKLFNASEFQPIFSHEQ